MSESKSVSVAGSLTLALVVLGHPHIRNTRIHLPPKNRLVSIDADGLSDPVDRETADEAVKDFGYFIAREEGQESKDGKGAGFSGSDAGADKGAPPSTVAESDKGSEQGGTPQGGEGGADQGTAVETDPKNPVDDSDTAPKGDAASAGSGEGGAGDDGGEDDAENPAVDPAADGASTGDNKRAKKELEWAADDSELAGKVRTLPDGEWRVPTAAEIKARAQQSARTAAAAQVAA